MKRWLLSFAVVAALLLGARGDTNVSGPYYLSVQKRASTTILSPNYYSVHKTDKATATPTAATAYVSSIAISVTGAGTSWSLNIKDKQATPLTLYTAASVAVGNTYISFAEPVVMTSGIDVTTAGTTAGTMDVFVTYWQ